MLLQTGRNFLLECYSRFAHLGQFGSGLFDGIRYLDPSKRTDQNGTRHLHSPRFGFHLQLRERKKLAPGNDTLYLKIITPEKNQITAQTAVPEAIKIDSYQIKNNVVSIHFSTSEDPTQNYYIYTLQLSANDSIFRKEVSYLNLSHYKSASTITRRIVCSQIAEADIAFISLMRITKDCYNYQISLNEANSANQGSITTPVPLEGNIEGALGIFTCYTEDTKSITLK